MKLELRRFPNETQPSREVLMLTDENGVILPCQKAVSISQEVDRDTVITVELIVDGERVRMNTGEEAAAS